MATGPTSIDNHGSSTRPYLLRALHDWCTDNGFTPYIAVFVDASVQVPMEYVKNNEIVLNVGFEATTGLQLGNEFIEFKARFGGVSREIRVPVDHVVAIYARENGQGMAFPMPTESGGNASSPAAPAVATEASARPGSRGLRLASSDTASAKPGAVREDEPAEPPEPPDQPGPGSGRPSLKRVK
jgi:stringent starvation protein B